MSEVKISATASIDRQTWDKVQAVLECHYLTISDALYLLMQNIADEDDLPFSCIIPGPETIAAMEAAERGELVTVGSVDDLIAELNRDDDDEDG